MKNHLSGLLIFIVTIALSWHCSQKSEDNADQQAEKPNAQERSEKKMILFFGNSLTAGYGIEEEDAFPALVQKKIDSLSLDYRVINGGLSGETTASGSNRVDWFLEDRPDIFVLELGANDGLRGIPLNETKKNLEIIIDKVKEKYPETEVLLAGMQIPPNMGQEYTNSFRQMYTEISNEKEITLIPFLLEGVAGDPDLNLPDGIHPTEEGHKIVAENIWENIAPLL
jgi:acyl-CoA thioesterase I